jgi:hypothetical protein
MANPDGYPQSIESISTDMKTGWRITHNLSHDKRIPADMFVTAWCNGIYFGGEHFTLAEFLNRLGITLDDVAQALYTNYEPK